ncbi:cyclin-dependent kinase 2-associated protein 2-like protein, partial [Leptotrombidium deliense]
QANIVQGFPPSLVLTSSSIPLYPGCTPIGVNNTSSKYSQLLAVIEEMGKDLRPIYSGSKTAAERFKRGIIQARLLIREALLEAERNYK